MTPNDILYNAIWAQLNTVHTALPGIIKSFDPSNNKASIQPALNKRFVTGPTPLPILENVPVMFPRGNNFSMTFPLTEGDYVLLVFIERSIDLWKGTGGQVTPSDPRKFDLSDAIAIPGLMPLIGQFPDNDNTSFNIQIGQSRFKISPDGTLCFHGASEELMSLLSELIALISTITVTASPAPNAPAVPIPINQIIDFTDLQTRFNTLMGDC